MGVLLTGGTRRNATTCCETTIPKCSAIEQRVSYAEFYVPTADQHAGRADFVQKDEEATKKVEQLKKDLGEKWDKLRGKKNGGCSLAAPSPVKGVTKGAPELGRPSSTWSCYL